MEFTELPNRDRAVVDLAKLRDYCLNPYHEDGKHKARVFKSALGVGRADAEWLRERILEAAATRPAVLSVNSPFGVPYVVDFVLTTASGSAIVRSGWIVRHGEDYARLTTCFVKAGAKR
jgi:hypothetical protein